ncbi:VOC family protein [Paenibacillus sp. HN-1]|uniref:VOC family protein n=1 Tax=Paenibacillus TaxID=44249 RepID=UPI001CA89D90|nr:MULTISPECIES: VOC family protein [Paenibacillus]MBY9078827.1 VOC family protein [Paenibacillus sp. CGMCC 1.18879]MBY9088013.1 VOC family protein [Paenibacillus sinensis]
MKLHGACIQTHNITELVDFYKKLFEQEPEVDGGVDFRFYAQQLIIFKLNDEDSSSTKNVALIYAVDDVDHEYRRLVNLGLEAVSPPSDKPWGVRSFLLHDPDGNTVSYFVNLVQHP